MTVKLYVSETQAKCKLHVVYEETAKVFDIDSGEVEASSHAPAKIGSNKRPCETMTPLTRLVEATTRTVEVKKEMAEVRSQMREVQGQLEDALHCVVCMVTPRSVVLQPCNHYVCCLTCAAAEDKCPATGCNTNITNRVNNVCSAPHLQAFEVS